MIVLILHAVPQRLKGEITRWLIEPAPGVFVGHVSARVREYLWEKCTNERLEGGVTLIWGTNNEQRFAMRMQGTTQRSLVEMEGLQLISIPNEKTNPEEREKISTENFRR